VCVSFLRVMTAAVAFAPTSVLDPRLRAVNAVVTSAGYFIGRCDGRISEEIRAFFGAAAKAVREPAMRAQLRAEIVREDLLHWFSFLIMNIAAESDHDGSENAAMISLLTNDVRKVAVGFLLCSGVHLFTSISFAYNYNCMHSIINDFEVPCTGSLFGTSLAVVS
jgi:hypothetical protein